MCVPGVPIESRVAAARRSEGGTFVSVVLYVMLRVVIITTVCACVGELSVRTGCSN